MASEQQDRRQMIAETLERQGLTQTDLTVALGRGWTTIQGWISGKTIPEMTPEETLEMCQVFNCSLEDLVAMFPGRSRRRAAIKESHRVKHKKTPEE
jgi:plasmid maintenance system antidote protein VapI